MNRIKASGAAIAISLLALSGCDRDREAQPDPAETSAPTPAASSIIRDDVEVTPLVEDAGEPLTVTVPFPDGGSDFAADAREVLAQVLESQQLERGWPIVLRGHTDSAGSDAVNLRSSRRRAEAVADWLIENGVAENRITVIAMGEQNPVEPNALPDGEPNEEGRAANRRVEIVIAPEGREEEVDTAAEDIEQATGSGEPEVETAAEAFGNT